MTSATLEPSWPAFLTPAQVEASRGVMGVDSQLISDGTYFVIEDGPRIIAAGGWSRQPFRTAALGQLANGNLTRVAVVGTRISAKRRSYLCAT